MAIVVGFLLIVVGVGLTNIPAGMIVGGVLLLAGGIVGAARGGG